jgi:hypothetical protein
MAWRLKTEAQRFWEKVDKTSSPTGCWLWTAGIFKHFGHGQFWVASTGKSDCAHRVAWRLCGYELPTKSSGLMLCHQCDVPACVNPEHLRLGTMQDNMNEMKERGRSNKPKGEQTGHAKVTEETVRRIREMASQGHTHKNIGASVGLARSSVGSIVTRKNWKHVA